MVPASRARLSLRLGLIVPPQADAERPSARAKRTTRTFALSTEPYIPMPQGQGLYGSAGREEPDILLLAWIYTSSHSPKFLGAYGSFSPTPCRIYLMYWYADNGNIRVSHFRYVKMAFG